MSVLTSLNLYFLISKMGIVTEVIPDPSGDQGGNMGTTQNSAQQRVSAQASSVCFFPFPPSQSLPGPLPLSLRWERALGQ